MSVASTAPDSPITGKRLLQADVSSVTPEVRRLRLTDLEIVRLSFQSFKRPWNCSLPLKPGCRYFPACSVGVMRSAILAHVLRANYDPKFVEAPHGLDKGYGEDNFQEDDWIEPYEGAFSESKPRRFGAEIEASQRKEHVARNWYGATCTETRVYISFWELEGTLVERLRRYNSDLSNIQVVIITPSAALKSEPLEVQDWISSSMREAVPKAMQLLKQTPLFTGNLTQEEDPTWILHRSVKNMTPAQKRHFNRFKQMERLDGERLHQEVLIVAKMRFSEIFTPAAEQDGSLRLSYSTLSSGRPPEQPGADLVQAALHSASLSHSSTG